MATSPDIASIGVEIETGGIARGISSLDELAARGPKVEKAMADVEKATAENMAKVGQAARSATSSRQALAQAVSQFTSAERSFIQALVDEAKQINMTRGERAAYIAQSKGMSSAAQEVAQAVGNRIEAFKRERDELAKTTSSMEGMSAAARVAGGVLGGIGISLTVKEFVRMADAATNIESRLRLVTGSASELIMVQADLFRIAQNSRVSFNDLVGTYAQMSRATKELGISQQDLQQVTTVISQAVTISGGSAQSAQAALIQLSQGFAAGALRGEELNSVMEQTPRLAQAIAQGLGVGIGELRKLGAEGQLTAEKVLGALQNSAGAVQAEFNQMAMTVEQATTKAENSALRLVGVLDKITGASATAASGVSRLSAGMDSLATDIERLASTKSFSDFMFLAFNNSRSLNSELEISQKQLSTLEGQLSRAPNNIYTKAAVAEMRAYVAEIKEAQARLAALTGQSVGAGGGRGSINPATVGEMGARRTVLNNELSKYFSTDARQTKGEIRTEEINKATAANAKLVQSVNERLVGEERTNALIRLRGALETEVANINEKHKDKTPKGGAGAARSLDRSELTFAIDQIRNQQESLVADYTNTEKLLEARRSAGLLNEKDYYAQKLDLLNKNTAAQEDALKKEIERLKQETFSGSNAAKDAVDNKRKIEDAQAKLEKVQKSGSTSVQVLALQEQSAMRQTAASYLAAQQAAKDYYDTTNRGYERSIQTRWMSNSASEYSQGVSGVEDRYLQQRVAIENQRAQLAMEGKLTAEATEQLDKRLALNEEYLQKSLDSWRSAYERMRVQDLDWSKGAQKAVADYLDDVANSAKRAQGIIGETLTGLAPSLTDALYAGNLVSFKDYGNDIAKRITEGIIEQNITAPLAQWLSGQVADSGTLFSQIFGGLMGGKSSGSSLGSSAGSLAGGLLGSLFGGSGSAGNAGFGDYSSAGLAAAFGFAKGGAFESPSLSRYSNQIHSTPKLFAFAKGAGVFGEAGAEAIMPLKRGPDGNLGVRASGGQGGGGNTYHITVPMTAQPGVSRSTMLQQGADMGRGIQRAMQRNN